jgi:dolichol-phosphate mannosyltransferase
MSDGPTTLDVSIIVPVCDEQGTIAELTDEIEAAMATLPELRYEVLFVDDGSRDGSWELIEKLAADRPHVYGARLRKNFGKAAALSVGADAARGTRIVTMDGDLQDDPAELPRFLEAMDDGADVVSGWKADRKDPLSKRIPSKIFNRVTAWASGLDLQDFNCGFKAAYTEVYRRIPLYGELHRYVPALASNLGYKVVELPVNHRPRTYGKSKYGFERFVRGFLDLLTVVTLTRFGRRPGHLFGGLGVLVGFVGFVILAYLTGVWVFTSQGIGNRPLLLFGVLLEILAAQMLSVGLLAELILNRTRSQPVSYLVAGHAGSGFSYPNQDL